MADHTFGVVYTPANTGANRSIDVNALDSSRIYYVRITWVDWINNVRCRVVPVTYFKRLLSSSRPGVSLTKACFGLVGLALAPGISGTGEYHYVLDLNSMRLCPYAPNHASIMGYFQNKTPHPEHGLSLPYCPRTLLSRIEQEAKTHAGISYLVGFESEFILLSSTSPYLTPVNSADWSLTSKLPSGSVEATVLQEIAENIQAAGIELQMYHAEAAPGQYEIVTGPLSPLKSADALISTRETIYNVANKHGLRATFAPRLYTTSCGSAAHAHISIHTDNSAPPPKRDDDALAPTMMPAERSWVQGVLEHIPALCALTLPTSFSYARVADGVWSGGTYPSWGTDQREAPLRLCGARGQHHLEVRFLDGTANPYLALAGILAAGNDGIFRAARLGSADCAIPVAQMTDAQRAAHGVADLGRLPTTLAGARAALSDDALLRKAFSRDFIEKYISVNETLESFLTPEDAGSREVERKLVHFY